MASRLILTNYMHSKMLLLWNNNYDSKTYILWAGEAICGDECEAPVPGITWNT